MSLFRRLFPLLSVAFAALPTNAWGQECQAGTISHVFIDNHSIFDLDEISVESLEWAYALANRLHIRTRAGFIRRELLFGVGDCYQPFLLQDSERILRRLPFISNADVYGLEQADGSWHVVVDTNDEWSTRPEVTAEFENGLRIRRASLSELNFLGRGVELSAFYSQDKASRQVGGAVFSPQFLGTETDVQIGGGQTRVGPFVRGGFTYPFHGEVGRTAWRVYGSRLEDYFDFTVGSEKDPDHLLMPLREAKLELTYAHRFGEPGSLTVLGGGISREVVTVLGYPEDLRLAPGGDFGNLAPVDAALADPIRDQTFFASGTRLNLLFGQRNIRFTQRQGLDALQGIADVEVGTEVSLTLSRTLVAAFGGDVPDDLNARFRFYAGAAPGDFTVISRVALEGRQIFFDPTAERSGWRDLLGEADLLLYWQPWEGRGHTLLGRFAAAGGWTVDRPFQLTLGGRSGVRGYQDDRFPGARRIVLNLEDRLYLGWPAPDLVDFGLTFFVDAGHIWAGDVPFGADSGWKGTVGAGLRLGLPAGSQSVGRLDVAWPLDGGGLSSAPVLRISFQEVLGLRRGLDDEQLQRTRLMDVGPDRFSPRRWR
jgi:hypothetical protein